MLVYVVRHSTAAAREAFERDDDRPLTEDGIKKMKAVAKGLCAMGAAPDTVYTSPLVRARQTAEILVKALAGGPVVEDYRALVPGRAARDVMGFLAKQKAKTVAVVGHEPQLGELVSLMVTGGTDETVDMKKAAVSCVEFEGAPAAGEGILLWHIVPSIVDALMKK